MLTIIREFSISVQVEYEEEIIEILDEFGAANVGCDYRQHRLGGKEYTNVYFNGCSLLANRFDALIERLGNMPANAFVTLTY